MKKIVTLIMAVGFFCVSGGGAESSLVSLANPLQGTDNPANFSHGNIFPAIALPFPMNVWAPYTEPQNNFLFYQYRHNQIRGLRQTHEPSRWIGDYANFSLMPVSGKLVVTENDRASVFRHEDEVARPGYYKVHLDTWNATAEITPTERAARLRFTFNQPADSYVILDVFGTKRISSVKIIPAENKIVGIARNYHNRPGVGVPENFGNYFVIVFDRPFAASGVWTSNTIQPGVTERESPQTLGAFLKFDTSKNRVVGCRVASSFISLEQAGRNLEREIGSADFDTVHQRAEARWNDMLGRALVTGGTDDQRRTFYSALYRATIYPHRFYELDENDRPVYFSPYDGKVHSGHLYTDSGFWDTFRSAHPLLNLLYPEIAGEILEGLLHAYDESGWLPEWPGPGHLNCMLGNHAFSLLADGWMKGIRTFDAERAVAAMVHDANTQGPTNCPAIGRDGAGFYNSIGYVPYSNDSADKASFRGAASKTLESAYDDYCAAQLARAIGKNAEAATFARRAMNYTNLFDATLGLMRGRRAGGSWNEPFYADEWGGPFTEGNSLQWTWSVQQDAPGLMKLLGGEKASADKLDALFTAAPTVHTGTYKRMEHEMLEMIAADMGQYAHGNEPVHHVIYLYNYLGQPWKTQSRVRQTMTLLYQATPDGICGDEDTGQMSAWYVFSALGIYPECPGDPNYFIGSPLFKQAVLTLPGKKTFTITAKNNGPQQRFIQSANLNGSDFDRTFIDHKTIVDGGELIFQMDSSPNYQWGASPSSRPVSPLSTLLDGGK
ncbi:MAG: GH92 family glycosyl hydrolase [Verrucomicrobiota bacterium]